MGIKKAKVGDYVAAGQGDPVVFWHRKFLRYSISFCFFSLLVFEICVDTVRIVEYTTEEDSSVMKMTMVAYKHSASRRGVAGKDAEEYNTVCNDNQSLPSSYDVLENWKKEFDQVILLVDAKEDCPHVHEGAAAAAQCHEHNCPLKQIDAYPEMHCMVKRMEELSRYRYIVMVLKMDTVFVRRNSTSGLREALSRGSEYFRKFVMVGHRKAVQKGEYCHALQSNHAENFAGFNNTGSTVSDMDADAQTGHEHICSDIDYLVFTTQGSIRSDNTPSLLMGPDGWEVFLVDAVLRSGPLPIIDLGSAGGALGLSSHIMSLQSPPTDVSSSAKQQYNVKQEYNVKARDAFLQRNSISKQLGRKAGDGSAAKYHHYYYQHQNSVQSLTSSQACI